MIPVYLSILEAWWLMDADDYPPDQQDRFGRLMRARKGDSAT